MKSKSVKTLRNPLKLSWVNLKKLSGTKAEPDSHFRYYVEVLIGGEPLCSIRLHNQPEDKEITPMGTYTEETLREVMDLIKETYPRHTIPSVNLPKGFTPNLMTITSHFVWGFLKVEA